jgi:hypothetical protein
MLGNYRVATQLVGSRVALTTIGLLLTVLILNVLTENTNQNSFIENEKKEIRILFPREIVL